VAGAGISNPESDLLDPGYAITAGSKAQPRSVRVPKSPGEDRGLEKRPRRFPEGEMKRLLEFFEIIGGKAGSR
jgi:hypothetical protein